MNRKFLIFTLLSFSTLAHANTVTVVNDTTSIIPARADVAFTVNNWIQEFIVPAYQKIEASVLNMPTLRFHVDYFFGYEQLKTENCDGWFENNNKAIIRVTSDKNPVTVDSVIRCKVETAA